MSTDDPWTNLITYLTQRGEGISRSGNGAWSARIPDTLGIGELLAMAPPGLEAIDEARDPLHDHAGDVGDEVTYALYASGATRAVLTWSEHWQAGSSGELSVHATAEDYAEGLREGRAWMREVRGEPSDRELERQHDKAMAQLVENAEEEQRLWDRVIDGGMGSPDALARLVRRAGHAELADRIAEYSGGTRMPTAAILRGLGTLRDERAVSLLGELLLVAINDREDDKLAESVLRALGKIDGAAAGAAMAPAFDAGRPLIEIAADILRGMSVAAVTSALENRIAATVTGTARLDELLDVGERAIRMLAGFDHCSDDQERMARRLAEHIARIRPALQALATSGSPREAHTAAWALAIADGGAAFRYVKAAVERASGPDHRLLVQQVLPTPVQEEDRKWLVDEIQRDPLPAALITVAADAGLREALPAIRHALTHPALDVSDAACDAVAQLGDLQSVPALRELAKRARSGAAERALIELEPK